MKEETAKENNKETLLCTKTGYVQHTSLFASAPSLKQLAIAYPLLT
jgi:hypothetical protein